MPLDPTFLPMVVGGLQGGMNAATSIYNTRQTIRANKEMAEYAYAKDLEQWERMNQYNSPASQMERYRAAGLNPNLIYGSGAASAGNASGSIRYNPPDQQYRVQAPDIMSAVSAFQDWRLRDAQIDQLEAQTKWTDERALHETFKSIISSGEAARSFTRSEILELEKLYKQATLDLFRETAGYQSSIMKYQAEQGRLGTEQSIKFLREQMPETIRSLQEDVKRKGTENLLLDLERQLREVGLERGDPTILRLLLRALLGQ